MFKKNTAVTGFTFGLVATADGSDITTGTPVGYYTLDGGVQTAINDVSPVYEGNGQWSFDYLAAEFNGDIVGLTMTHTSAITVHFTIKTDTKIVSELQDIAAGAAMNLAADAVDAAALDTTAVQEIVNGVWDEGLTGSSHNTATTAGRRLREVSGATAILQEGTAQAGAPGSITLASAAEATEDEMYHDAYISLLGGTGAGQVRALLSYDASTRIASIHPNWAVNPSGDTEYIVSGCSQADVHSINESVTAADNLALDYDGTGYTKANSKVGLLDATQASIDAIEADTDEMQQDDIPALIAALNNLSNANVLTQVNAALDTAIAELGIGTPTSTPTIRTGLMLLYMAVANKRDTVAALDEIHNAAGTVVADATLSDDTVVFSKGRYIAP